MDDQAQELAYDPQRVTWQDDGTATYTLVFPVRRGDEQIEKVTLRRPRVADIQASDAVKGEVTKQIRMLSQVTGLEDPIIKRLELLDFAAMDAIVGELLGKARSRRTSPTR